MPRYAMRSGRETCPELYEMTATELREAQEEAAKTASGWRWRHVYADEARQHVANGLPHNTGLYRDHEGRIRYAESGC